MYMTSRDITALTARESSAPQADNLLRETVEMIEGHFVLFDANDRMTMCNQRYRELNRPISDLLNPGVSFREILKAAVAQGLYLDAVGREREFIEERLARHARPDGPFDICRSGGCWIRIHERLLSNGGRFEMGTDVTDRVRAKQEINALKDELERRVEQRTAALIAANQELEAFSYSIAHDLKAPLRAISGFAAGLRDEYAVRLEEAGKHGIARIIANAARMTAMIDDLLGLSQVTRTPLTRRTLDPAPIARAAAKEALAGYPCAHLVVADMPPTQADYGLLLQVYSNLIGNALKFSCKRQHAYVEVGAERQGDVVVYFVRDNGAGFDMRDAHRLFGVFQRLHSLREFEGTGIGLAIVRRIVQRHGGRVWADAAPEAGTTFYFTLEPGKPPPAASA